MASLIDKIKSLIIRFFHADIVKVFSWTSMSTLVRMCTGLVSVKIVATIIGPTGVALVGQLNNFATMVLSFSSGGINSGITKYVSEHKEDSKYVKSLLSNALKITAICSAICSIPIIILHRYISKLIMLTPEYGYVFLIFGFTLFFYAANNMLLSIMNGFKEFKRYVRISIANTLIGFIFTITLVITLGLPGALISAVTFQSVMLFITIWMIRHLPWFHINYFKGKLSKVVASKYFRYTLMTLTSAIMAPVSQMFLRGYVMAEISEVEAGWWEGMNRISAMYLMVITSSFSIYYLPRLSELQNPQELHNEIFKAYKVIVPMLLAGFSIIYFLRFFIIKVLFTPAFEPMQKLFIWQLSGDFFKICSWLLAFIMVAKAMTKAFMATEIIFTLIFVGLGLLFIYLSDSVIGLNQAYLANYILYTLVMIILFHRIIFLRNKTDKY